jgi:hypothetical protein
MHRLLKIGFQSVGFWELDERRPNTLQFYLRTSAPYPHALYAFTAQGEVKYVGKTTQTLRGRLTHYANGLGNTPNGRRMSTNARVAALILDALRQDNAVEIHAFQDTELHQFGDFHLSMAAGLEDSIIRVVKPEWNGGRRGKVEPVQGTPGEPIALPNTDDAAMRALPARDKFQVKIGTTYLDKGFFNTGVQGAQALAEDGETIRIFCGEAKEPILGIINRRANTNRSPRIFGGRQLREWIQRNLRLDEAMQVEVLTPTAIRLSPGSGQMGSTGDQGRQA